MQTSTNGEYQLDETDISIICVSVFQNFLSDSVFPADAMLINVMILNPNAY